MPTSDKAAELAARVHTRTRASAARRSSASWCTSKIAADFTDALLAHAGLDLRRPAGPEGGHGDRDRRCLGHALRVAWSTRPFRSAPGCCTATSAAARCTRRPCSIASTRDAAGEARDLRPGLAGDHVQGPRRRRAHRQRHALRAVVRPVHEPARRHHPFRARARGRHRERVGSARLPARTHALRRHQGFRPGLQGRGAGSHQELHQHEDLFDLPRGPGAANPRRAVGG